MKALFTLCEFASADPRGISAAIGLGINAIDVHEPSKVAMLSMLVILAVDASEYGNHNLRIMFTFSDGATAAAHDAVLQISTTRAVIPIHTPAVFAQPGIYHVSLVVDEVELDRAPLRVQFPPAPVTE